MKKQKSLEEQEMAQKTYQLMISISTLPVIEGTYEECALEKERIYELEREDQLNNPGRQSVQLWIDKI